MVSLCKHYLQLFSIISRFKLKALKVRININYFKKYFVWSKNYVKILRLSLFSKKYVCDYSLIQVHVKNDYKTLPSD